MLIRVYFYRDEEIAILPYSKRHNLLMMRLGATVRDV